MIKQEFDKDGYVDIASLIWKINQTNPDISKCRCISSFQKKLWYCIAGRVKQKFGFIKQVDKDYTTLKD